MIPKSIKREHIIKAIEEIKKNGVPKGKNSKKFFLEFNKKHYSPKYVISLANKYTNGKELDLMSFSVGKETNDFLKKLGFNIIEASRSTRRIKPSKAQKETKLFHHNERCPKCKEIIKKLLEKIYEKVKVNYKFDIGVFPEDFKNTRHYKDWREKVNKEFKKLAKMEKPKMWKYRFS